MKVYIMLLLWVPVVVEKIISFEEFKSGMMRQPFAPELGLILIWLLPALEGLVVVMLLAKKWRRNGFLLSAGLLGIFTLYVGLAVLGAWGELPCTCGSVISRLTWGQHFFFNVFFLVISIWGCIRERSVGVGGGHAKGGPA